MVRCSTSKMNASKLVNSLLSLSHVRIRNVETVAKKLQSMAQATSGKLMTISDFDYTLSRYHKNGKQCVTTHGLFESVADEINPDFKSRICALRDKYIVIEYCPETRMEDKIPMMEEWWRESHGLIEQYKPKKSILKEAVKRSENLLLRFSFLELHFIDGCADFLLSLHHAKVPVVLFSAGIGQIIEFVLEHQCHKHQMDEAFRLRDVHIISNFMHFSVKQEEDDDETEECVGFVEPLIHTFNKNSSVISQEAPFFKSIADRTSVLLLGDSLGDVHMDVGVCHELIVLKIGYLNFNFDSLLERYMDEYDIVLIDDQTMEIPSKIFSYIHDVGKEAIADGHPVISEDFP
ncbi:5'-nucleotidase [Meloidogyne graminicola]|uniref:5'-nucleotidase n=1 Tax=Meloidogyne graminicola TaxID=189291 RepID=A0A8T0A0Y7_9BILA|nr:5'-nucleotidase [Meloidogyne graminicola]